MESSWLRYWNSLNDIPDEKVREQTRALINRHLQMGGHIHAWIRIRQFLIDEISRKKGHSRKGKIVLRDATTKAYYKGLLFGKKEITEQDPFPAHFTCLLEEIMSDEFHKSGCHADYYLKDIYYNHGNLPQEFRRDIVDLAVWELQSGEEMFESDKAVMKMFRDNFIAFLKQLIDEIAVTPVGLKSGYIVKKINVEYRRIQRQLRV